MMNTAMVLLISAGLGVIAGPAESPKGKSDVSDPILARTCKLIEDGEFARATELLKDRSAPPDAKTIRLRDDQLEIIRRIRLDFRLNEKQITDKIRKSIPDVTADDVRRWQKANVLQHRIIDGEILYFVREPSNLFKLCPEAVERRDKANASAAKKRDFMAAYLTKLVGDAATSDAAELDPVRHRVTFTVSLKPQQHTLKPNSLVRVWLPYPQQYRQQSDITLVRAAPKPASIGPSWDEAKNGEYQRSLYFEQRVSDPAQKLSFEAVYEFTTAAYCPKLDPDKVQPYDTQSKLYREYTAERPPHVIFSPALRKAVEQETAGVTNPLEKARRLFLFVGRHMKYTYEMEYSTIPSLSEKAIHLGRGDCGVHAMLFITLCRAAGIPARWQTGWQTEPGSHNMHDWAEFYVEPWGWLPADAEHGLQNSDDPRVKEFFFGHLDPYRLIVNLDHCSPLSPPKDTLRSDTIDFQRGEVEVDGENWYYDEWDYVFRVEYLNR